MNIKLVVPVEIEAEDLIETIHEAIDHPDIPKFIKHLDLRYQDFEVTEKIIAELLYSMTKEFEAVCERKTVDEWSKAVVKILNMMEEFD